MVKKKRNKSKMCNEIKKVQTNKMCKTIRCAKNNKMCKKQQDVQKKKNSVLGLNK